MKRLFKATIFSIVLAASLSAAEVKNVLFIVSDDLKASVLGAYGDKFCKTPNIDKLAESGVVFERTYCQGLVCGPSRKSFMFSRYPGSNAKNHPSMAEHFKSSGIKSMRVGKIYHMRVPGDIIPGTNGPDHEASWTERYNSKGQEAHTKGLYALLNKNIFTRAEENRESTAMPHRMFVSVEMDGDGTDQPDHRSATKAIELINANKDSRFFLAVGFVRPHYPSVAPKRYFDMYPYEDMPLPKAVPNDLDDIPKKGQSSKLTSNCGIGEWPDNIRRMWSAYYATVTFMDDQVGRILDELDRLGLRDTTAVVFTSDHGYHLGEHEFWQKANLHEDVTRVPLIMSIPGMKPGRSMAITELMDIYPTLAEAAGLEIPSQVQGLSLMPVLKNHGASVREAAFSVQGKDATGLRSKDWAYMNYGKGGEELYNMSKDPGQFTNLAKNPEYSAVLADFRKRMKARK
jgi:iduronate 2-sulfatase